MKIRSIERAESSQRPEDRLIEVADKINEAEINNATPLDKAILTLSSAALALSLTFSKDIAQLKTAVHPSLLFISWGLFVLTIAVNITGFLVSLHGSRKQLKLAFQVFRHGTATRETLQARMDKDRTRAYWANVVQGILFLAAMATLALYVSLNTANEIWPAPPPVVSKLQPPPSAPPDSQQQNSPTPVSEK
jgi:hypothetical protein